MPTTSNLVDEFIELTSNTNSPALFRKWGAIVAVAGALERKVWVRTKGSDLFPNLYVVLCAPPGIGKTQITAQIRTLWDSLEEQYTAPSSLTKASLIDTLNDAARKIFTPGEGTGIYTFNALNVASNELGVLIPSYENEFMNALTDIYDGKDYSERRRTKDLNIKLDRVNLNILAGCTPGYLKDTIPPGAWDQGFLSRVIIVYSGDQTKQSLFFENNTTETQWENFNKRIASISKLYGKFKFTEAAMKYIDTWYLKGGEPTPNHPKLTHYNTRRVAHLLKLSMVAACVRYPEGQELLIEKDDIHLALSWLLEAEVYMPDIFKSMAAGGDSEIIQETFHYVYEIYMKNNKMPVTEARLVMFLQSKTAAHNIVRVIEIMEKGGMLSSKRVPKLGKCYTPMKPEF